MTHRSMKKLGYLPAALVILLATSCEQAPVPQPPETTRYVDVDPPTTDVWGYTFDPEVYFIGLLSCMDPVECPPPLLMEGLPWYDFAQVEGAQIQVLDVMTGNMVGTGDPSYPDGTWHLAGVEQREGPPYFLVSTGGSTLAPPVSPFTDAVFPTPTEYVPTLSMFPFSASHAVCAFQQAISVADNGTLEALALYQTAQGTPTTVADLLDPAKSGGVALVWMYAPGDVVERVPAFETTLEASHGTVLNLDWAPPGDPGLPPEVAAIQSARGFYVADGAPASPIGLAAVLVAPTAEEPLIVIPTDPIEDPMQGRPWGLGEVDAMVQPGQVSYGAFQIFPMGPPPGEEEGGEEGPGELLPPWLCFPM